AAELGRVARRLAVQELELAPTAARTLGVWCTERDAVEAEIPNVEREQGAVQVLACAGGQFQRLGGLNRGDGGHRRADDTRGVTRRSLPGWRRVGEDAAQAGRLARQDRH